MKFKSYLKREKRWKKCGGRIRIYYLLFFK